MHPRIHRRTSLLATVLIAPIVVAGCADGGGLDPNVSSALGNLTGGQLGGGSKEMQYLGAGSKMLGAAAMTDREAAEIGEAIAVAASESYGIVPDDKLNGYVTKVGLAVAAVSDRPEINYTFGVLDTDEVNALSMPGGFVFITRGALAGIQDESELAGVLAHEIAHITRNHGKESIKRARGAEALGDAAKVEAPGFIGGFIDGGLKEIQKPMGQGEETAADVAAVGYLKAAGYDPRGYLRYLERSQLGGQGSLMSTHPSNAARVAKVKQAIGNASGGATLAARYQANTASVPRK